MLPPQPSPSTSRSTVTCADSTGTPLVIVQACRSCTSTTPGWASMCRRTSTRSTPRGVPSSSTSPASRSSRTALGTISAAMTSEAIGSARSCPVTAMTPAATSTATEPSASPSTSRNAPRTLSDSRRPPASRTSPPMLAAGPLPAEGPAGGRDPSGHPDRQQGEADAERVGGHVAGVGEQREAAGEQSDDHLEDQHGDGDPEHGGQPAAVGGGSRPRAGTGVPVIVPHDYDGTAEARFAPMVWLMQPDPTAVLGELMRRARDAGPGQLASLVADAAAAVGLADAVIYLADYGQTRLMPVPYAGMPARLPLGVDGTLAGRAYRTGSPLTAEGTDQARRRLWLPLCEGHERLGVLEATIPAAGATDGGTAGGTAGGTTGAALFADVVAM